MRDQDPDPAPRLQKWKIDFFYYSQQYQLKLFYLSLLKSIFKFSGHKYSLTLHLVGMDTNQGPEPQALDAHPDPEK
jgi:hypothetical protein